MQKPVNMPRLSDALKRKKPDETSFEKEQQLQIDRDQLEQVLEIEAQIAARAKKEEEAAAADDMPDIPNLSLN